MFASGHLRRLYPALVRWPGAGVVTIGGFAFKPST
jgi:hypothetical protein